MTKDFDNPRRRPLPNTYNMAGRGLLPIKHRLRPRFLRGCVVEELVEYSDGRQRWERCRWPVIIEAKDAPA